VGSSVGRAHLLEVFAQASDALFDAGITRSDSFTGDIGEFVAARTLGLALEGRNTATIDATKDGKRYQVKSIANANRHAAVSLVGLKSGFEILVCVRLSSLYEPVEVIEVDHEDLPKGTRSVNESLLRVLPCTRHTSFPAAVTSALPLLRAFGRARQALLDNGIIRSSRVVGEGVSPRVVGIERGS